jgi:hypothetical protein
VALAGCFDGEGSSLGSEPALLADWTEHLVLHAQVENDAAGKLVGSVFLEPGSDGFKDAKGDALPCPLFDLRVTINDDPVEVVSRSGRCSLPEIRGYLFDPALVRERQRVLFGEEDRALDGEVVTRFEVVLQDASGTFAYRFARELPTELSAEISSEQATPREGDRVEVRLTPAPAEVTLSYLVDGPEREDGPDAFWVKPPNKRDGSPYDMPLGRWKTLMDVEQTENGFSFTLPELKGEQLDLYMWPWSERLDCPFAACLGGASHLWTSKFVGLRLPLDR